MLSEEVVIELKEWSLSAAAGPLADEVAGCSTERNNQSFLSKHRTKKLKPLYSQDHI